MIRIVCLGDSLTEGYLVDTKETWVSLLNSKFDALFINCGISGDTTTGMMARMQRILIEEKPDVIIILGGTNDLFFGLDEKFIISNIMAMSRHAKHSEVKTIIGIPPPYYPPLESEKFPFLTPEEYAQKIEKFQRELKAFSSMDDQMIIDFSCNMIKDLFLDDGLHPNSKGHAAMKENAVQVLKEKLSLS